MVFLGTVSEGKRGLASDKQPISVLLSTREENRYPQFLCLDMVKSESAEWIAPLIQERVKLGKERVLNTDGKKVYEVLKDEITVHCEKVDYAKKDHRLFWLNTMISNLNSVIVGIYHGIAKKDLYLFLQEFSWRTNHRCSGATIMQKVHAYIADSAVMTNKQIMRYVETIYPFIAKLA